ncbi:hypothetical protein [Roseovarius sp. D0-M9]|uniref:hypothetical protein n=1 Tax=Roseovarius sp. D0-M9 TaxID=3127117 RepID=UPI00300FF4B5
MAAFVLSKYDMSTCSESPESAPSAGEGSINVLGPMYVSAAVRNREIGTISEIAHMYPAC